MNATQVVVIGFVAWIGRQTKLFGRIGMDKTGIPTGVAEGALHDAMVLTSAFNGDDQVAQVMLAHGLANEFHDCLQAGTGVLQRSRVDENSAVEVGQHEFGTKLGTIDADDAEVFWSDRIDTVGKLASGFLEEGALAGPSLRRTRYSGHKNRLSRKEENTSHISKRQCVRSEGKKGLHFSLITPIPRRLQRVSRDYHGDMLERTVPWQ